VILLDGDCLGKRRSPCDACAKLGASSGGRSSMRIRTLFAVLGLSTIVGSSLLSQVTERVKVPDRPPLMEQEREMKMALSAATSHLRDGAGVYVLRAQGYEKAHDTSNGFTCIVVRDHPLNIKPTCWDSEGTATIVPRVLREGELLMKGMPLDEIKKVIADDF